METAYLIARYRTVGGVRSLVGATHAYPVWTPTGPGPRMANGGPYPSVGICDGAAS